MEIQEGIGRAGYRILAAVFLILGIVGLAMAWLAIDRDVPYMGDLGFLFAGAGLLALFGFALHASSDGAQRAPRAPRAGRAAAPTAPAAAPSAAPGFDYDAPSAGGYDPAAPTGPTAAQVDPFADAPRPARQDPAPMHWDAAGTTATPAPAYDPARPPTAAPPAPAPAPAAPAAQAAQANVQFSVKDKTAWPGADKNTWRGSGIDEAADAAHARRYPRKDFTDKYTKTTPMVRNIINNEPVPEKPKGQGQFQAPPPSGKTRGACGRCGTILLAPQERPIKIRCPVCTKTTLLE